MKKNHVILSLGSNTADKRENVASSIEYIRKFVAVSAVSSIYETLPWGGEDKLYANCVVAGDTDLELDEVVALAKDWELKNGRDEVAKRCGIVPVDIDAVVWNDEVLRPQELNREYFLIGYRQIIP